MSLQGLIYSDRGGWTGEFDREIGIGGIFEKHPQFP